jgi:hypothetical protein
MPVLASATAEEAPTIARNKITLIEVDTPALKFLDSAVETLIASPARNPQSGA